MTIKLSICIPTYNRIEFLPGTINSILYQYTPEIQIVISDNCSTDGTKEWVQELIAAHPEYNIKYFCWDKNMGADLNYMKVIEIADGEYCWFMGSDDQIREDAVKVVMSKLSNEYDTLLFCRTICNINLIPYRYDCALNKKVIESTFNFSNDDELTYYLANAMDLSALFSYLSTIIIKKAAWNNIQLDYSFIGSAYSHVYKIFSLLRNGGVLFYSAESVVFARVGNDSFLTEKLNDRLILDLDGYSELGDKLFPKDFELRKYFWIVLRKKHGWKSLYKARINAQNKEDWQVVEKKLLALDFKRSKITIINNSYFIINLLLKIYKVFKINKTYLLLYRVRIIFCKVMKKAKK